MRNILYLVLNYIVKKNDIGLFVITKDLVDKKIKSLEKARMAKINCTKNNFILSLKNQKYMHDRHRYFNKYRSPNIFEFHKKNTVSVVSIRKYMPYDWKDTTRK